MVTRPYILGNSDFNIFNKIIGLPKSAIIKGSLFSVKYNRNLVENI